jgi:hypothetical protein
VPSKPAPKPTAPDYPRKLELYERLVATNPKVERRGDTMPYTSVNGNMFSLLTRSGTLALRLPDKERDAFLRTYATKLTEQYGIVMKEYVDVPDALLADTRALAKHFAVSYAYVSALRAKPTTKPKTAANKAPPGKKGGVTKKSR